MNKKIKVAIVGIGNCASALIQGFEYYKNSSQENIPGVMFSDIGGYRPSDIEVVAAFDVDKRKVGTPLKEAIFSKPNCCRVFASKISKEIGGEIIVQKAPVLDGVSPHMLNADHDMYSFQVDNSQIEIDLVTAIKNSKCDLVINYLPVGSQLATENLATCCINAGVAFLNCIPVFIASDPVWEQKFIDAGLPIIGDDMRSQAGSSILSQVLNEMFIKRGVVMLHHIQENRGSNTDFCNMTDKSRLVSKKESKENVLTAVFEQNGVDKESVTIYAGPSNFIPLENDNKEGIFDIKAEGFGGAPIHFIGHLKVCDSENSAGVVIDAIRFLKVAREVGAIGALRGTSCFSQKTPPKQLPFEEALNECKLLAKRKISPMLKEFNMKE